MQKTHVRLRAGHFSAFSPQMSFARSSLAGWGSWFYRSVVAEEHLCHPSTARSSGFIETNSTTAAIACRCTECGLVIQGPATAAGSIGGKACGAGGGGCLLFFAAPGKQQAITEALSQSGVRIIPFQFDFDGLQVTKE